MTGKTFYLADRNYSHGRGSDLDKKYSGGAGGGDVTDGGGGGLA